MSLMEKKKIFILSVFAVAFVVLVLILEMNEHSCLLFYYLGWNF